jgi:nitrite reductase (NO-forming)
MPGVFPPLKGSGVVNKDDPTKHIQVVLNGMQGARAGGVVYAAAMPPFSAILSDGDIAASSISSAAPGEITVRS